MLQACVCACTPKQHSYGKAESTKFSSKSGSSRIAATRRSPALAEYVMVVTREECRTKAAPSARKVDGV